MVNGGPSVTLDGVCLMLRLPAYNWAMQLLQGLHQVCVCVLYVVCTCVRVHVCVYVCVYVHVCVCVCVYMCVYVCECVYCVVCVCVRVCMCVVTSSRMAAEKHVVT